MVPLPANILVLVGGEGRGGDLAGLLIKLWSKSSKSGKGFNSFCSGLRVNLKKMTKKDKILGAISTSASPSKCL